ncbi:MAG TPA: MBL fold metallo-hydrolase [Myxococcaceae bacterium]|nr:MBL fold metallo-hydrolase [Myxococcaceae bacterium]
MSTPLYVRQLQLGPMENFVYLVGARDAPEVAVVDPAWDVDAIEKAAKEDGKKIAAAFLSHCHGDHINGLPDLLARHDIPAYAQREEIDFSADLRRAGGDALRPLNPGDELEIGPLRAKALHTPGHTPGSQCLWLADAVASGDTVFVNACGRCDLKGGDPAAMHRTIQSVLMRLPDETRLLPGHDYGDVKVSTLGREKANNPYFRFPDLLSFVTYRMRPRG